MKRFFADPELRDGEVAAWAWHLRAAGWERTRGDDWQLFLARARPQDSFYAELGAGQWVNRFPGMAAWAVKSELADNLRAARQRWHDRGGRDRECELHPRTFSMPDEYSEWRRLAEAEPNAFWLSKPKASSRGRGISIVTDLDAAPRGSEWLIQEYIQPHLLDGFKYGLRFYVLLTSLDPLIFYVHEVGTCRFATRPYSLRKESLEDPLVHLTNTAIQQTNTDAVWWQRNLGLGGYQRRLEAEGADVDLLFETIHDSIARTLIACREQPLIEGRGLGPSAMAQAPGCFEFLGVDVQVDEQLRPWILECNPAPPMEDEGGYDEESGARFAAIKNALMGDTLSLLGFSGEPIPPAPISTRASDVEAYWRERSDRELANCGGWMRLWPGRDAERWLEAFPMLRPLDRLLAHHVGCTSLSRRDFEPGVPSLAVAEAIDVHRLDDGLALYDPNARRIYALNAAASAVWLGLTEGLGIDELAIELVVAGLAVEVADADGPSDLDPRPPSSCLDPRGLESQLWDLVVAWADRGLLAGFERRFALCADSARRGFEPTPFRVCWTRAPIACGSGQDETPNREAGDRRTLLVLLSGAEPPASLVPLEVALPDETVDRLGLVYPSVGGRGRDRQLRLAPARPAAILDALALEATRRESLKPGSSEPGSSEPGSIEPGSRLMANRETARAWIEWIDRLDLFELE